MRPVAAEFETNQDFAAMPTAGVVGDRRGGPDTVAYWVALYGNYQPFGHAGMDILTPIGTPVHAIADGVVLWADWGWKLPGDDTWGPAGYFKRWGLYKMFPGIVTVIQHNGWISIYAHLSSNDEAPKGTVVKEGQLIGKSGASSGYSMKGVGAHLHVEALVDLSYKTGNGLIYGRTDPTKFFGGISVQGTTTQEEYEVISDIDIKKIAQATADVLWPSILKSQEQFHNATRVEVAKKIEDSEYEMKVFSQEDAEKRHLATREEFEKDIAAAVEALEPKEGK